MSHTSVTWTMMALCWLSSTCESTIFTLLVLSQNLYQNGGVGISNCRTNRIELYEDAPEPITCENLTTNGTNIWRLHDDYIIIGECSAEGNCTNYFNDTYQVSRRAQSTESQLVIYSNFRDIKTNYITCEDAESDSSHTCVLVIKHHPVLSECQVHASATIGYVSGSCFANKMFSSDNLYACTWSVKSPVCGFNCKLELEDENVMKKKRGSWGNTKTCHGDYCWGTCSFSHPQPQEKGLYTYTIMVLDSDRAVYSQNISIDGSLSDTRYMCHVKRIIIIVVPVTIVTAAIITLVVVVIVKRKQNGDARQSINDDRTPVHIYENTRMHFNEYSKQNEMISREDDTDRYNVVCDAIDTDYEICDDKDPYDRRLDDTTSSYNCGSLSSEQQSADFKVNV